MAELEVPHLTEEQLSAHYFGETDDVAVVQHLSRCVACTKEFEALKVSLAQLRTLATPALPKDFESQLWAQLQQSEPGLRRRRSWWQRMAPVPRWGWAAALAGLAVAAFFAGRLTVTGGAATPAKSLAEASAAPHVRERLLVAALSDHLDQSERILIEINNQALGDERERAENMLAANRLYRQCAAQQGQTNLLATLDDLERVLLDVAHAPPQWSPEQLRELKARVSSQGLLFKVKVLGSRMRDFNAEPNRTPVRAISTSNSL